MKCAEKKDFPSRMAAESALARVLHQKRVGLKTGNAPRTVYRCTECDRWHLSSWTRADAVRKGTA